MTAVRAASLTPSLRDASSLPACVIYREAVRQWGAGAVPDVSLDQLPPSVSAVMVDPEKESALFKDLGPPFMGVPDKPYLDVTLTYGPGVFSVSGKLDPAPVEEEFEAWFAYERSQRWFSREGLKPRERVLTVVASYRGATLDYHARVNLTEAVEQDPPAAAFHIASTLRHMNREIDRLVLARVMGEQAGRVRS